jgi:hypothetical protein
VCSLLLSLVSFSHLSLLPLFLPSFVLSFLSFPFLPSCLSILPLNSGGEARKVGEYRVVVKVGKEKGRKGGGGGGERNEEGRNEGKRAGERD